MGGDSSGERGGGKLFVPMSADREVLVEFFLCECRPEIEALTYIQ